jgi:hypothetical protein
MIEASLMPIGVELTKAASAAAFAPDRQIANVL